MNYNALFVSPSEQFYKDLKYYELEASVVIDISRCEREAGLGGSVYHVNVCKHALNALALLNGREAAHSTGNGSPKKAILTCATRCKP